MLAAKLPPRRVSNHKLSFSHKGKSPEALKSVRILLLLFILYKGCLYYKEGQLYKTLKANKQMTAFGAFLLFRLGQAS